MTAPSDGTSRPARILSTVVLPQPEWPMMQTNSPRAIDSHRSSNTVVLAPPGAGKHLLTPSIEMNLSVMAAHAPREGGDPYSRVGSYGSPLARGRRRSPSSHHALLTRETSPAASHAR